MNRQSWQTPGKAAEGPSLAACAEDSTVAGLLVAFLFVLAATLGLADRPFMSLVTGDTVTAGLGRFYLSSGLLETFLQPYCGPEKRVEHGKQDRNGKGTRNKPNQC